MDAGLLALNDLNPDCSRIIPSLCVSDDDGIDSYIAHLEMIETSLKRELMSIEYIWQQHGVDLSADRVDSAITDDDASTLRKGASRYSKDDVSFELFDMDTFSETDDESSQQDGSVTCDVTESDCESTDFVVPIREVVPMVDLSSDMTSIHADKRDASSQTEEDDFEDCSARPLHDDEQPTLSYDTVTTDLLHRVIALQEELESTKVELAAFKMHVNGVHRELTLEETSSLRRLGRRTLAIIKGAAAVSILTFGSLIVFSTVQRRPMGCGHGYRL